MPVTTGNIRIYIYTYKYCNETSQAYIRLPQSTHLPGQGESLGASQIPAPTRSPEAEAALDTGLSVPTEVCKVACSTYQCRAAANKPIPGICSELGACRFNKIEGQTTRFDMAGESARFP